MGAGDEECTVRAAIGFPSAERGRQRPSVGAMSRSCRLAAPGAPARERETSITIVRELIDEEYRLEFDASCRLPAFVGIFGSGAEEGEKSNHPFPLPRGVRRRQSNR